MPRPTTKADLVFMSRKNFDRLNALVDSLSEQEQERDFPPGTMNRNIRDVLAHLHHWHLLMLSWYEAGMKGAEPAMPVEGLTWKQTPELNRQIWETYRSVELTDVKGRLNRSHRDVQSLIDAHSDEELFEKKRYPWTGSTSLGAYLVSATSSHYDWAYKLIKRAKQ